jgi:hypothetical protein
MAAATTSTRMRKAAATGRVGRATRSSQVVGVVGAEQGAGGMLAAVAHDLQYEVLALGRTGEPVGLVEGQPGELATVHCPSRPALPRLPITRPCTIGGTHRQLRTLIQGPGWRVGRSMGESRHTSDGGDVLPIDVRTMRAQEVYVASLTAPVLLFLVGVVIALAVIAGVVGALAGLVLFIFGLVVTPWVLLRRRGHEAWLTGSVLTLRGAFKSRRIDLASAEISVGSHHSFALVTTFLVIHDPDTGHVERLALNPRGGQFLPATQLNALADAIVSEERADEAVDRRARQIALRLREFAADPFAGHL